MAKTITSSSITFLDTTDSRKLTVDIASNLPTVQVYDVNTDTYSPDWSVMPLVLTPTVYIDSKDITTSSTMVWERQDGTSDPVLVSTADRSITINENMSDSNVGIVTYICTASYENLTATSKIVFTRSTSGTDVVVFQIYAPDGYLLSKDIPSVTLQTYAYSGSTPISSNATYAWYSQINHEWVLMEHTGDHIMVNREDVVQSMSYRCEMTYNGNIYYSTITIQDKGDIYNAMMCVSSNADTTSGEYYWILYTLVYSEVDEKDPLLGIISQTAPESPMENQYWYAIDIDEMNVVLKKYNGTEWVDTSDSQSLSYNWSMIDEENGKTILNNTSKVRIVSSYDFASTVTFLCEVESATEGILAQTTMSLTDVSDPILSQEAPPNPNNGQIWIKQNADGSFLLFVWDAENETWVMSDADTRNRVYTSRPSSYNAGDLWITARNDDFCEYISATDYVSSTIYYSIIGNVYTIAEPQPQTDEEIQTGNYYYASTGKYAKGTLLQATVSSAIYDAADWVPSLKYDKDIEYVQEQLDDLNQYITMSSEGLRIRAKTDSGEISPYNSLFTSTKLAFRDGDVDLLTIGKSDDDLDGPSRVIAPEIEVQNELVVGETIRLGNLNFIIEDNGSFSFVVKR